jgi:nicotinate-nucleotide--dimethylbenzimidazole phosphoribosyltransferase
MTNEWWLAPVEAPCALSAQAARLRQAQLTKPAGSLGRLEEIAIALAGWQGRETPSLERIWISLFAADHGVAAEGVSLFPQAVTGEMLRNFAAGGAAISVLARDLGARLELVDLGTVNDVGPLPGVRHVRIAPGTRNFCCEPAMDGAQFEQALGAGRASVAQAREAHCQLFIAGEMGIGNTTAAAALVAALLGLDPAAVVGAGTGLDADGIAHKARVIERAFALHAAEPGDAITCACAFAGFEIVAMAGAFIAAAQARLPVLVDGFIAGSAALLATRLNPGVRDWMLFGHRSAERGHARVLDALDARPLLDLGMRLGEGSGAAVAVPLLRAACSLHAGMATFAEAAIPESASA